MSAKKQNHDNITGMKLVSYGGRYASQNGGKRAGKHYSVNAGRTSKKVKLLLLLPAVAVVLLAILIPLLLNRSGRHDLTGDGYQYYGGSVSHVADGSQLMQGDDGQMRIVNEEHNTDISTDLPIYYKERSAVVLPGEMIYYAPREGIFAKSDLFSEVVQGENGDVRIVKENREANVDRGFLFDGEDFYLFLEPMVLKFNGYTLELPAMSYVEARFNGDVMVFNYETEEFLIEPPKDVVTASVPEGDYEISLLNDSMTLHDGSRMLLFTRPDLLESVQKLG